VALARFRREQKLLDELSDTRRQLADRKLVERAKGVLMARSGLTEDQAYQKLRSMAMNKAEAGRGGAAHPRRRRPAGLSDKPEKEEVKVGFIPLTDCASVVMASVLGFDKKYGIKIVLEQGGVVGQRARQAGQRRTRRGPRAVRPDLRRPDGHRRPEKDMAVLMNLNTTARPSRCRKKCPTRAASTAPRWPS
jgi:hypothetical protein